MNESAVPEFGAMDLRVRDVDAEGVIYAGSPHPLPAFPGRLTDCLIHWAGAAPDRTFLAERGAGGEWRSISYAGVLETVRGIAQALLDRGLSEGRPVAVLSGNDVEHALLGLAAQYVGVPYVPVSPTYALGSDSFGKLRHVLGLIQPGLIFAADGDAFGPALQAAAPRDAEIVCTRGAVRGRRVTAFGELRETTPTPALAAVHSAVGPDTIAKVLFTSGSTGMPKGVINTQRMLCSNQAMLRSYLPFLAHEPPVLLDWLPWHHTFGGNHNLGLVLYNGGTLYIDDGRPMPGAIERTVANLESVSPTLYFNVPKGYEALLPYLQSRPELARRLFGNLRLLFCAAAALPEHLWQALSALARRADGRPVPLTSGYGATETSPAVLFTTPEIAAPGAVGVPVAGIELKLVPFEGRYEVRVRGPNVTPGYWHAPEKTAEVFDEEGYYRLGDALRFVDGSRPGLGFRFDGRLADNFKLASGTWVNVGQLRERLIADLAPLARDVVIIGENRDYLCAIVIPEEGECRRLAAGFRVGDSPPAPLRQHLAEALVGHLSVTTGSSTRVRRLVLLDEALSLDAGEVTDKGSVNQRAVRQRRQNLVERLYATEPDDGIVVGDR